MKILGLSFDYHDSSAALVIDGKVIAAAQEERFSRTKHDPNFPIHAIKFCLKRANMDPMELDAVVYYENPILKFDRVLKTTSVAPEIFKNIFFNWINKRKFEVSARITETLKIEKEKVFFVNHHQSHAAVTYFCSPFSEATIITLDGAGEFETMTISVGAGTEIKKIYSANLPNSLGLFYSAFTAFLGFQVNEGEYKVMGMSAFGSPVFYSELKSLINFDADGHFNLSQECFDFFTSEKIPYTKRLTEIFGAPRDHGSEFDVGDSNTKPTNDIQKKSRHYANIAASLQMITEEVMLSIVDFAIKKTGITKVCLAGGVALNSLANEKIQRKLRGNLYIHPAAGDSGSALGAALYHYALKEKERIEPMTSVYLGEDYSDEEIVQVLEIENITSYRYIEKDEDLYQFAAKAVHDGCVIAWFQGRFEWGPRALGARSILANPMRQDMKSIVNNKIKFREPFRPFAPSVLENNVSDYFKMVKPDFYQSPEYFMLSVVRVREEKRNIIPAVTHVDGTARIQLVWEETNPRYYSLIKKFAEISGVPMLLNTSFNLKDEPVVASPADALKTFYWCDLDYLVINNFIIGKDNFL